MFPKSRSSSSSDVERRPLLTIGSTDDPPLMSPMRAAPPAFPDFGSRNGSGEVRETILDVPLLMAIADGNGNGVGNDFR